MKIKDGGEHGSRSGGSKGDKEKGDKDAGRDKASRENHRAGETTGSKEGSSSRDKPPKPTGAEDRVSISREAKESGVGKAPGHRFDWLAPDSGAAPRQGRVEAPDGADAGAARSQDGHQRSKGRDGENHDLREKGDGPSRVPGEDRDGGGNGRGENRDGRVKAGGDDGSGGIPGPAWGAPPSPVAWAPPTVPEPAPAGASSLPPSGLSQADPGAPVGDTSEPALMQTFGDRAPAIESLAADRPDLRVGTLERLGNGAQLDHVVELLTDQPALELGDIIETSGRQVQVKPVAVHPGAVDLLQKRNDIKPDQLFDLAVQFRVSFGDQAHEALGKGLKLLGYRPDLTPEALIHQVRSRSGRLPESALLLHLEVLQGDQETPRRMPRMPS